ncbi:SPFH domain-containing protein [Bifidobacterium sp. SMB2]|uniref:SPFH domain-containing protein n=2 Tax=Bifidobacterium TaxID=1678 RepID=A0ABX0C762_9BIFI|nr:SPFH domain-containing protein [Bifidobacterium sp. SMB2]NEH10988.1 SPFH domain-containing protein [Bifidobacterium saimiriisciurei]
MNGWPVLAVVVVGWVAAVLGIVFGSVIMNPGPSDAGSMFGVGVALLVVGIVLCVLMSMLPAGFFSLQPNEARVLVLFGEYRGTVRGSGFYWANPFYSRELQSVEQDDSAGGDSLAAAFSGKKKSAKSASAAVKAKISLRARTLNGPRLKVNDRNGNPIEIADVVVWRVVDTARAVFDVDHYEQFVGMQAETALRHVASRYAYDHNAESDDAAAGEITLRSNIAEVSEALRAELAERLESAGIAVDDARLTHLAYAPEIAQVMLRRQQAEAIIAARTKIVQGAVSMVDMALKELERDGVVELDEERKATMVSNLMVVLCGDNDAQPVVNAGSLYN